MEQKFVDLLKEVTKSAKGIIEKEGGATGMLFMVENTSKGQALGIMPLSIPNADAKIEIRNAVKSFLVSKSIEGYIIIFDTKMTKIDPKGKKEPEVMDMLMVSAYTPKEKVINGYPYRGKKFLSKGMLKMKGRKNQRDEWDIWNTNEMADKFQNEYAKYKEEHPEKYKEVQ